MIMKDISLKKSWAYLVKTVGMDKFYWKELRKAFSKDKVLICNLYGLGFVIYLKLVMHMLQHAHNLVNWFPWSEKEAFDEAKRENKPIFLSIGYSYLLTHTYLSLVGCSCESTDY